jgi:hypothetical protein
MKITLRRNYGFLLAPVIVILVNLPRYIERKEFFFLFLFFGIILIVAVIAEFMRFYKIENQQFYLETFFIKTDKVAIESIKSIHLEKGNWLRPDYLTIKHGKFDATYVTPRDNKELIDAFLLVNPAIEIKV